LFGRFPWKTALKGKATRRGCCSLGTASPEPRDSSAQPTAQAVSQAQDRQGAPAWALVPRERAGEVTEGYCYAGAV